MTKADGVPLMEESSKHYSASKNKKSNLTGFILIWVGQFFSMTGSFMTSFALAIWAWEKTGSAQALAMVGVFTYAPLIIVTPFVGVLVDRWNRKLVMMLSDLGAVLASCVVFVLFLSGELEIWHIYATTAFASAFQAFQWPAYSASVSLMVPKKHYSRASGLISMVESTSNIVGPVLAGAVIGSIGVKGILIIDILTFFLAIVTLLVVFIPQPNTQPLKLNIQQFWADMTYGFHFIFRKPGLLGLQLVFFGANFMTVIAWAVVSPMVLARTGGDAQILGLVQSFAAFGGLMGAIFLTVWGGPKKLVWGVLIGWVLSGLLGRLLMGISQDPLLWILSAFLLAFFMPTVNGCNQVIWQRKVPPEKQGRVFSVRRFIAQITIPVSMWISGWLADHFFEPAFTADEGWGTRFFSSIFGSGEGAGLSMIIAISGVMVVLVGLLGFTNQEILCVESKLPDYDDEVEPQETSDDRIVEMN